MRPGKQHQNKWEWQNETNCTVSRQFTGCVAGGNQGSSSLHFLPCSKARIGGYFSLERRGKQPGEAVLPNNGSALSILLKPALVWVRWQWYCCWKGRNSALQWGGCPHCGLDLPVMEWLCPSDLHWQNTLPILAEHCGTSYLHQVCFKGKKQLFCLPASSTKSTDTKARKEEKNFLIYKMGARVCFL